MKVQYIRPKYANLKEWMDHSDNVYIGRKGVVFVDGERYPKRDSIWANPFKIGRDGERDAVIQSYERHIREKLRSGEISIDQLKALKGKRLGCWCKIPSQSGSVPCHGDVLVKLLGELAD